MVQLQSAVPEAKTFFSTQGKNQSEGRSAFSKASPLLQPPNSLHGRLWCVAAVVF